MARKQLYRACEPMDEGVYRELYQYFFGRLIQYKPDHVSIGQWMEHLFHTKSRFIERHRVEKPFRMPGLLYVAGSKKVQGTGYRDVPKDAELWVRVDETVSDQVDVLWLGGVGNKELQYCLTDAQWDFVQQQLRPIFRRKWGDQ